MTHFADIKDTCTVQAVQGTALEVADLYIDKVIRLHGKPKQLVSDRDTRFQASFWQELQDIWECRSAWHLLTNCKLMDRLNA